MHLLAPRLSIASTECTHFLAPRLQPFDEIIHRVDGIHPPSRPTVATTQWNYPSFRHNSPIFSPRGCNHSTKWSIVSAEFIHLLAPKVQPFDEMIHRVDRIHPSSRPAVATIRRNYPSSRRNAPIFSPHGCIHSTKLSIVLAEFTHLLAPRLQPFDKIIHRVDRIHSPSRPTIATIRRNYRSCRRDSPTFSPHGCNHSGQLSVVSTEFTHLLAPRLQPFDEIAHRVDGIHRSPRPMIATTRRNYPFCRRNHVDEKSHSVGPAACDVKTTRLIIKISRFFPFRVFPHECIPCLLQNSQLGWGPAVVRIAQIIFY